MLEEETLWSGVGHEGMRVLILRTFEDDVFRRHDMEPWLDGLRLERQQRGEANLLNEGCQSA